MLKIGNTLVSLDMVEKYFCCDLDACLGACCIEGDAGAPLNEEEDRRLKELYEEIKPWLTPREAEVIATEGTSYRDPEGELVTQLVEGGACAYTCIEKGGLCLCALEKARRAGNERLFKPISCSLYPARIKEYDTFTAVNYDRWKICRPAETLGKKKGIRVYEFLREPLVRRFGQQWYDELALTASEYLKSIGADPGTPPAPQSGPQPETLPET